MWLNFFSFLDKFLLKQVKGRRIRLIDSESSFCILVFFHIAITGDPSNVIFPLDHATRATSYRGKLERILWGYVGFIVRFLCLS